MSYNIRMQVKLCPKHMKVFKSKVQLKLTKGLGIYPGELIRLWREAENCFHCEWKTTFGKNTK